MSIQPSFHAAGFRDLYLCFRKCCFNGIVTAALDKEEKGKDATIQCDQTEMGETDISHSFTCLVNISWVHLMGHEPSRHRGQCRDQSSWDPSNYTPPLLTTSNPTKFRGTLFQTCATLLLRLYLSPKGTPHANFVSQQEVCISYLLWLNPFKICTIINVPWSKGMIEWAQTTTTGKNGHFHYTFFGLKKDDHMQKWGELAGRLIGKRFFYHLQNPIEINKERISFREKLSFSLSLRNKIGQQHIVQWVMVAKISLWKLLVMATGEHHPWSQQPEADRLFQLSHFHNEWTLFIGNP